MTVDEARIRFPSQWVLMTVFELDEHRHPVRGYVLRHSRSRMAISNRLAKEPPRSQLPKHERFYIFYVDPPNHRPPIEVIEQAWLDLMLSEEAFSDSA